MSWYITRHGKGAFKLLGTKPPPAPPLHARVKECVGRVNDERKFSRDERDECHRDLAAQRRVVVMAWQPAKGGEPR